MYPSSVFSITTHVEKSDITLRPCCNSIRSISESQSYEGRRLAAHSNRNKTQRTGTPSREFGRASRIDVTVTPL